MKWASLLLLFTLSASLSASQSGYPVFQMIKQHTYDVGWGTAFMVEWKDQRYLVSNWHVCRHQKTFDVRSKARKFDGRADVIATFPDVDLCLLTPVDTAGLKPGRSVPNGYPVYTGGYPEGSPNRLRLSAGVTTRKDNSALDFGSGECPSGFKKRLDSWTKKLGCWRTFRVQDTTMAGKEGRSGSPVLNAKGDLVGIVNMKNGDKSSFLPVESLVKILRSLEPKSP